MKAICYLLVLWLLTMPGMSVAAPANDLCSGATVIPAGGPFPYLTALIPDVTSATTVGDPGYPSCAIEGLTNSVWFKFSPTNTAIYRISTCDDTGTTVDDTAIAVYRSVNTSCSGLSEVACGDDVCGTRAAVTNTFTAGRTYFIVVWRFAFEEYLGTSLQLRMSRLTAPANDGCANAVTVPASGPFPHLTPKADITLATISGDPPAPDCQSEVANSVWYKFRPAAAGIYRFSTCDDTATTVDDTILGIYTANACGGPYTPLGCSDDGCNLRSAIALPLQTNTTAHILVWGYAGAGREGPSDVQLRVSKVTAPEVLSVNPVPSLASVTLNALIAPKEGDLNACFEWGTSTNYDQMTPVQLLGTGTNALQLSEEITDLIPGVLYHGRVVATNEAGITMSQDFTFHTAPLQISSYQLLPEGKLRLSFSAAPERTYRVLASTNLVEWTEIGTTVEVEPGRFEYDDPMEPVVRFYRVVWP